MLTLERISSIGSQWYHFLKMFGDCFARSAGKRLLKVDVQGQLSNIKRKNCEAIALTFNECPRLAMRSPPLVCDRTQLPVMQPLATKVGRPGTR